MARSWVFLKQNLSQFTGDLKPQCRSIETASTTHQFDPHDCINRPRSSGQISSLKACISLLCSSTFDRFVKELSKFRGRSLVHRDPPAFRLDCEAIGAGFIVNFSLISSNFPLEFRTSARKNLSILASIHEN